MGGGREARWKVGASLLLRAAAAIGTLKVIFLRRWPLPSRAPTALLIADKRSIAPSKTSRVRNLRAEYRPRISQTGSRESGAARRQAARSRGRSDKHSTPRPPPPLRLASDGGAQSRQHGTTGVGECRTSARVEGRTVHTGIWKDPVHRRCRVGRLNLEGDGQGDLAGHGGERRAVWAIKSKRLTIGRSS
jgi:hypothetical protein